MSLAISDYAIKTFTGVSSDNISLTVQPYERVIIFVVYNPGTGAFGGPTITDITGSGTPLSFLFRMGGNGVRTTNNGIIISRGYVSDPNPNLSPGIRTFDVTISLGPYSGVLFALSMSGANSNNTTADRGNTLQNSIGSFLTVQGVTPVPTVRGLGIAFFIQASNFTSSPRSTTPTNGFNIIAEDSVTTTPDDWGASLVVAEQIVTSAINSQIQYGSNKYEQAVGYTVGGPFEYSINHTTNSYLNSVVIKDHNTDSLLNIDGILDHDTDSLLKVTITKQHASDSLLNAEYSVFHATDGKLWGTYVAQHQSDTFINFTRAPDVKKLLVNNVPTGKNLGLQDVRVLSVNGNTQVDGSFDYKRDPQEFIVSDDQSNQLSIIDPIIKKKL